MSQQNDGPTITFTAGEALESHRRVKMSGVNVVYADADEDCIGVTQESVANGANVAVRMKGTHLTHKIEASAAVAAGAVVYGTADGKVDDAGTTSCGTSREAASAAGSIIEVLFS